MLNTVPGPRRHSAAQRSERPARRVRGSLSRQEILEAALGILTEEHVESLSMRRIADRLQCSVASPYAHFASREAIIRELIVSGERRLTAALRQASDSSDDVYEQLGAIAHAYWDFAAENRELHKLMFNSGGGRLYRQALPALPTSYRVFLETIRRGIASGAIRFSRRSYPAIARTMWSWMYGLIVLEMGDILRRRQSQDPVEEGIQLFRHLLRTGENSAP